jgi:hypothetical protein
MTNYKKDTLYLLVGLFKIPVFFIKMVVAVPIMLLAFLVMIGKGAEYPFNNVFGHIVGKILHGELPYYYLED